MYALGYGHAPLGHFRLGLTILFFIQAVVCDCMSYGKISYGDYLVQNSSTGLYFHSENPFWGMIFAIRINHIQVWQSLPSSRGWPSWRNIQAVDNFQEGSSALENLDNFLWGGGASNKGFFLPRQKLSLGGLIQGKNVTVTPAKLKPQK